jgi:glucose dehydrogenase
MPKRCTTKNFDEQCHLYAGHSVSHRWTPIGTIVADNSERLTSDAHNYEHGLGQYANLSNEESRVQMHLLLDRYAALRLLD